MARADPPAATDVLCEQCGYTLNGLPPQAACPECGLPIVASTSESPRRPPEWEQGGRGAARTIWRSLFSPRRFFRTLDLRPANKRSHGFSILFIGIGSLIATQTVVLHYLIMADIAAAPAWLPRSALMIPLLWVVILGAMFGTLELVAVLAAAEGRYWGYRLTTPVARRAMHYLTPHLAAIVNLPYLVVIGFLLAVVAHRDFGIYVTQYLYVLSGTVVVAAFYLFRIFMYAMRGIVFANPPGSNPMAAAGLLR